MEQDAEYVGKIEMLVGGKTYPVISFDVEEDTGRKPVKAMKKGDGLAGFTKGNSEIKLKVTVPESVNPAENCDWAAMDSGKLVVSEDASGRRTSYLGCFTMKVNAKYTMENEVRRDIELGCLRKVKE